MSDATLLSLARRFIELEERLTELGREHADAREAFAKAVQAASGYTTRPPTKMLTVYAKSLMELHKP